MTDSPIDRMKDYLAGFIERPHPTFNNLPICPFAKKARLSDAIEYAVLPLDLASIEPKLRALAAGPPDRVGILISPGPIPWAEFLSLLDQARLAAAPLGLKVFEGHPESDYAVNGLHTRRDPCPNFQVIHETHILEAETKLGKSRYYRGVSPDILRDWHAY